MHRLRRAKEKKFASFMGSFTDEREVDALDIQAKAVDMALRVHGAYKQGRMPEIRFDLKRLPYVWSSLTSAERQSLLDARPWWLRWCRH